ncbi:MAG: hypothetical protein M1421_06130 [Candidatus Eremiobacteraeota bacterium]|nr:hypothetical protein [Candidatus Eremiobacteraeota bacterium]
MKKILILAIVGFLMAKAVTASPFRSLKRTSLGYSVLLQKRNHVLLFEPSPLKTNYPLKKDSQGRGLFSPLSLFRRFFVLGKTLYSKNHKLKSAAKGGALGVYYHFGPKFLLNGKYVVLNDKRVGNFYQEMNFPLLKAEYWFNARTRISISYKNVETGPGSYPSADARTTAKLRVNF